jgi:hypothetical protein
MFEKLCNVVESESVGIGVTLQKDIDEHLTTLRQEFQRYFPELTEGEAAVVRNPFSGLVDVSAIANEI